MRELHLFADMKTCSKCKVRKPKTEFYKNRTQCDGLAYYCKVCARAGQALIYAKDPEKHRRKSLEYRAKHGPEHNKRRKDNRREVYVSESARRYGTTKDVIRKLLQIIHCEICGNEMSFAAKNVHRRPNIDHDHESMRVRGVLCGYCNNMLGRSGDNPDVLLKAVKYLNERS